jgi:pimeloyl-ACP methyl ester carboxylesterase
MPVAAGIAYERHGGGRRNQGRPPLLLIHGAGATRLDWPASIRQLPGAEVLAIDLPGHGDSPGAGSDRIEAYRERVLAFLDALRVERVMWVGHSMGSAIALSAGLDSRERVATLILVGSGARLRVNPAILELVANEESRPEAIELFASACFGSDSSQRMIAPWRTRLVDSRGLRDDLRACDGFDVMGRLAEITCRTLVVCGEEDRMTPVKYSRYLADGIAGAELCLVPNAGHMVMLEKPRAVADEVRAFLARTASLTLPLECIDGGHGGRVCGDKVDASGSGSVTS